MSTPASRPVIPAAAPPPLKLIRHHVVLGRLIGAGSYGEVFLANKSVANGSGKECPIQLPERFVVKVMKQKICTKKYLDSVQGEIRTLEMLRHPHIVEYLGSWVESGRSSGCLGSYCIAMQYCEGGDLHDYISSCVRAQKPPPESVVVRLMAQCFSALHFSHQRRIIHRDIKPGNVFVLKDRKGTPESLQIGDYGLARTLEQTLQLVETRVGTPAYLSPEICAGEEYSGKTDVFSAGTMFYEMMALRRPFWESGCTEKRTMYNIIHRDPFPEFVQITKGKYSRGLTDLLRACLAKNEANRPTAREILTTIDSPVADYVRANGIVVDTPAEPGLHQNDGRLTPNSPSSVPAGPENAAMRRLVRVLHNDFAVSLDATLLELLRQNQEVFAVVKVLLVSRGYDWILIERDLMKVLCSLPHKGSNDAIMSAVSQYCAAH